VSSFDTFLYLFLFFLFCVINGTIIHLMKTKAFLSDLEIFVILLPWSMYLIKILCKFGIIIREVFKNMKKGNKF